MGIAYDVSEGKIIYKPADGKVGFGADCCCGGGLTCSEAQALVDAVTSFTWNATILEADSINGCNVGSGSEFSGIASSISVNRTVTKTLLSLTNAPDGTFVYLSGAPSAASVDSNSTWPTSGLCAGGTFTIRHRNPWDTPAGLDIETFTNTEYDGLDCTGLVDFTDTGGQSSLGSNAVVYVGYNDLTSTWYFATNGLGDINFRALRNAGGATRLRTSPHFYGVEKRPSDDTLTRTIVATSSSFTTPVTINAEKPTGASATSSRSNVTITFP